MHRRNVTANFDMVQIFLDNVVIFFSYCVANLVYQLVMDRVIFLRHLWIYSVFAVIFTLIMLLLRMYDITTFYYMDRIVQRTTASTVIAGMSLSMMFFMYKADQISRLLFVLFCVLSCTLVLFDRFIVRLRKNFRIGNGYTHILFVGDDDTLERYTSFIDKTAIKLKIDKYIHYDDKSLRSPEAFTQLLMKLSVDEVQFVYTLGKSTPLNNIQDFLEMCENMGVTVRLVLNPCDLSLSKRFVSSIGTYPVITYHSVSFDKLQLFIKSIIDIIGSAVGLVLLSPIFILTAIFIKLESPGPIFFKQLRAGINGKVFEIYKFRSMYTDAEERKEELAALNKIKDGMMFKIDADPRVTKVGAFIRKTSIDELPQLLNVLKREMSLVGTRPPTMDEVQKYCPEHRRRISILPGITGMWQVNGRSQILNFEDVVKLDKKYIDEWSLFLDLKLLLQTFKVVFTRRGAS